MPLCPPECILQIVAYLDCEKVAFDADVDTIDVGLSLIINDLEVIALQ